MVRAAIDRVLTANRKEFNDNATAQNEKFNNEIERNA